MQGKTDIDIKCCRTYTASDAFFEALWEVRVYLPLDLGGTTLLKEDINIRLEWNIALSIWVLIILR